MPRSIPPWTRYGSASVANDNEVACPYEVRKNTKHALGEFWYVARKGTRSKGNPERISERFSTVVQAYRCMAVLIADDRARA